jgi:hypothetical protein
MRRMPDGCATARQRVGQPTDYGRTAVSTATDRHDLEVLPLAQCLALLRSRPLGRLAYLDAGARPSSPSTTSSTGRRS